MTFTIGTRVEIHPRFDRWMMGDRFGEVVSIGPRSGKVFVKMDRTRKTIAYAPADLTAV